MLPENKTICECGHDVFDHSDRKADILQGCKKCGCFQYKCIFDYRGNLITEDTHYPVCPHCGVQVEDWWEDSSLDSDGASTEVDCGSCEEEYEIIMSVDTTFVTRKTK